MNTVKTCRHCILVAPSKIEYKRVK